MKKPAHNNELAFLWGNYNIRVRELVKNAGGKIVAKSVPGKGIAKKYILKNA